ncbi:A24 family peptidase [Phosphitispora sp. TUW77]|uniref:A24 family peptidase n=1 Tax=Phosphitispora sp. TUW77 TaxID=3152361 RepID=UPI003AB61955
MITLFMVKSFILAVALGTALYFDIRYCRIKNSVTYPAAVGGFLINFAEYGTPGLLFALKGWLIPVLALFVFYYINVMGAGDIKLFAAIGAIMGVSFVMYCFLFSVYIGGIIACGLLIRRKQFMYRMKMVCGYAKTVFLTGGLFPYGIKGDNNSKFIFTAAIVPGTIVNWVLLYLNF